MEFAAAAVGKLRLALEKKGAAVACALSFAGGFFTSASSILSSVSPFGVAFVGAVSADSSLWAAAGAVTGYLTQTSESLSLRYLASIVLLIGLRWSFGFIEKNRLLLYTPLMAGLSLAVTGFAIAFSGRDPAYGWGMVAVESAICASSGILFSRAMRSYDGVLPVTGTAGVCTAVLLCALMTGAANVFSGEFPPVYAVALWAILCAAHFGRNGQAVTVGAASGVAAALTGQNTLFGVLTVSALSASAFSPLGRVSAIIAAAFSGVLAALAAGNTAAVRPFLISCVLSGGAFLLTPLSAVRSLGLTPSASTQGASLGKLVSLRLSNTGASLEKLAETAREVSAVLEKTRADHAQSLIDSACQKICRKCSRRTQCWQKNFDTMTKYAGDIFYGREPTLPDGVECQRSDALSLELLRAGEEYLRSSKVCGQADSFRHVTAEQFSSAAALIESLRHEFDEYTCADESVNAAVSETLSACGQAPLGAGCFFTPDGRCRVLAEVPTHKAARLDPVKTAEALSETVCQKLSPAISVTKGGDTSLLWESAPPFTLETCSRQKSAGDSQFCGDSCAAFTAGSRGVLLISDGMGVGRKAAVDSAMSVSLIERLVTSGVDIDAALSVLNAALLSRGDERLCAVDAAVIDLDTLRLETRKAGAAPSFVWRKGRVHRLDSASLPVGILGGLEASRSVFALQEGDLVVLVSDGLTYEGDEWIPSQIAAYAEGDLSALCDSLIETADKRAITSHRDDRTVIAARVTAAK